MASFGLKARFVTKQSRVGLTLIAVGVLLPVATYGILHVVLAGVVAMNPGQPANQGAMVIAFFVWLASLAAGLLAAACGAAMMIARAMHGRNAAS
jgi:hypothetical protein